MQLVLTVLLELVQQGDKGLISPSVSFDQRRRVSTRADESRTKQTLASLSPLLSPFFHLVHPKSRAAVPGPFTRLSESSLASRQALDLVFTLSRDGSAATGGLVQAVDKACELRGGALAQRWTSLRASTRV